MKQSKFYGYKTFLAKNAGRSVSVAFLIVAVAASLTAQNRAVTLAGVQTSESQKLPKSFNRPIPPARIAHRLPLLNATNAFPSMVLAAGMIFSGEVTSITHNPTADKQTVATVAITFHVDNAVRGVTVGQDVTITEWNGLWNSGQRYRVGDRLMLFLYPPSKLGLTSWVAGPLGRFAIDGSGNVQLSGLHIAAFRGEPLLAGRLSISAHDFMRAVQRASFESAR
jgi:hypothetical protein